MDRRIRHRPQRILLVDDSEDIRHMWRAWLTFWGFAVDEARNGAEAVTRARANRPDLVLMDLWMPVLDGLEATARLKSTPETANVPVLAMSANPEPPTPERAIAAGCDEFLPKPLHPDVLIEHLRAALGRSSPSSSEAQRHA